MNDSSDRDIDSSFSTDNNNLLYKDPSKEEGEERGREERDGSKTFQQYKSMFKSLYNNNHIGVKPRRQRVPEDYSDDTPRYPIAGHPTYTISEKGYVYNPLGYVLAGSLDTKRKYPKVKIERETSDVHRLATRSIIGEPPREDNGKPYQIHHKTRGQPINRIDNLEWVPQSTNIKLRKYSSNRPVRITDRDAIDEILKHCRKVNKIKINGDKKYKFKDYYFDFKDQILYQKKIDESKGTVYLLRLTKGNTDKNKARGSPRYSMRDVNNVIHNVNINKIIEAAIKKEEDEDDSNESESYHHNKRSPIFYEKGSDSSIHSDDENNLIDYSSEINFYE